MLRIVLLCAVGTTAVRVLAETPHGGLREWTDASDTKRAHAVLIRIEGDTLWLRRTDGKLTKTTMSRISEGDRHYVASRRLQLPSESNSLGVTSSVIENATHFAEAIKQLPQWLEPSQLGASRSPVPAAVAYVRVSGDFLENHIERTVRQRKEVRDCILGTRIVGQSDTTGQTRLTLIPGIDQLRANISFYGNVRARTRGYQRRVTLHNISDSRFRANKMIALDDLGLRAAPSAANVSTRLRTTFITTSLPRLRGRIATRIAWRRVAQSNARAEAITSDHTAADIRSDFDRQINQSMANVQNFLGASLRSLEIGRSPMPTDVRYRCKTESVEMGLVREDATADERKLRPPVALEDSDVSVRLHRSILTSAIEGPQLVQTLAPMLTRLLNALAKQEDGADSTRRDAG